MPTLVHALSFLLRAAALPAACLVFAPGAAADDGPRQVLTVEQQASYDRAWQSVRMKRYADAYGRFAHLADRGHGPSAELALLLYRHGPSMFASGPWSATPDQQRRWTAMLIEDARRRDFRPDTQVSD